MVNPHLSEADTRAKLIDPALHRREGIERFIQGTNPTVGSVPGTDRYKRRGLLQRVWVVFCIFLYLRQHTSKNF